MKQEIEQLDVTPDDLKPKKKKKITIDKKTMVVLGVVLVIVVVIFIAANKDSAIGNLFSDEEEITTISTGSKWGDAYANYLSQHIEGISKYDVSFIDLNGDDTPEMLFQYLDENNEDTLRIYYLYRDEVLVTKIYHNYSLHLLYSVINKDAGWYIYIDNGYGYGAYTNLGKIVDGTAKDSDIKARNDKEVETYKRAYVDGKYKISFYEIKSDDFVNDFTSYVSKYSEYKTNNEDAVTTLISENSGLVYEEKTENNLSDTDESFVINGYRLYYGNYYGNTDLGQVVLNINDDKTITYLGDKYTYSSTDRCFINSTSEVISVSGNNSLIYNGIVFKYNASNDMNDDSNNVTEKEDLDNN